MAVISACEVLEEVKRKHSEELHITSNSQRTALLEAILTAEEPQFVRNIVQLYNEHFAAASKGKVSDAFGRFQVDFFSSCAIIHKDAYEEIGTGHQKKDVSAMRKADRVVVAFISVCEILEEMKRKIFRGVTHHCWRQY